MAVQVNGLSWKDFCKNWLNEEGILYHCEGTNSAPSKDFCILDVGIDKIVMVIWKALNPFRVPSKETLLPIKHRCSYEEFKNYYELRAAIECQCQGQLEYVDSLISGRIDYLCRIDQKIQMKIIGYLDMNDVYCLMRTNKYFKKLCYRDEIWHGLYLRSDLSKYASHGSLQDVAQTQGWKMYVYFLVRLKKINKIKTTARSDLFRKASIKAADSEEDLEVAKSPDISKLGKFKSSSDLKIRSLMNDRRFSHW